MKIISTLFSIFLLSFVFVPPFSSVSAYNPFEEVCSRDQAENAAVCNEVTTGDPISGADGVIIQVVQILSFVAGAAAVILIIIAGLKYVTSNGDSNGINSAKHTILYALIGLIIIILAQPLIRLLIRAI